MCSQQEPRSNSFGSLAAGLVLAANYSRNFQLIFGPSIDILTNLFKLSPVRPSINLSSRYFEVACSKKTDVRYRETTMLLPLSQNLIMMSIWPLWAILFKA